MYAQQPGELSHGSHAPLPYGSHPPLPYDRQPPLPYDRHAAQLYYDGQEWRRSVSVPRQGDAQQQFAQPPLPSLADAHPGLVHARDDAYHGAPSTSMRDGAAEPHGLGQPAGRQRAARSSSAVAPEPPGAGTTLPPSNNQMDRGWTPPGPDWVYREKKETFTIAVARYP